MDAADIYICQKSPMHGCLSWISELCGWNFHRMWSLPMILIFVLQKRKRVQGSKAFCYSLMGVTGIAPRIHSMISALQLYRICYGSPSKKMLSQLMDCTWLWWKTPPNETHKWKSRKVTTVLSLCTFQVIYLSTSRSGPCLIVPVRSGITQAHVLSKWSSERILWELFVPVPLRC